MYHMLFIIIAVLCYGVLAHSSHNNGTSPRVVDENTTIVMVVLGCAMPELQKDRIDRAIEYVKTKPTDPIIWFLTGGVKNAFNALDTDFVKKTADTSEAARMANNIIDDMIDSGAKRGEHKGSTIVLDETARNTAENFVNLKQWMLAKYATLVKGFVPETNTLRSESVETFSENEKENDSSFPKLVFTTSEFHKDRATKIYESIFQELVPIINVTWNVGKKACSTCWADEKTHMRNVDADVIRALYQMHNQPRLL